MSEQYSGNTIGGTYRSKRSNVLIDIRRVLMELDALGTTIDQLNGFDKPCGFNMGLPFDDLHSDNLGINRSGKLVVIDC